MIDVVQVDTRYFIILEDRGDSEFEEGLYLGASIDSSPKAKQRLIIGWLNTDTWLFEFTDDVTQGFDFTQEQAQKLQRFINVYLWSKE